MALVTGTHTVLVFRGLQFLGTWTRYNGASAILYEPIKKAQLVVTEDNLGNFESYYFELDPPDDVWVTYGGETQVHVPRRCIKKVPGNAIRCS